MITWPKGHKAKYNRIRRDIYDDVIIGDPERGEMRRWRSSTITLIVQLRAKCSAQVAAKYS